MSEIVNIHLGGFGSNLGLNFWEQCCEEHNLDPNGTFTGETDVQTERITNFFKESSGQKYLPRAIFMDSGVQSSDIIKCSNYNHLFTPDSFISSNSSTNNCFAKGRLIGQDILEQMLDSVRREAEESDYLQGFQLTFSTTAGTGGAFSTLLMEKIREEYEKSVINCFSLFPSDNHSNNLFEPYNVLLTCSKLVEFANGVSVVDNEALERIFEKTIKINQPTFGDLNHLIAATMCGISSCARFPGQISTDFKKMLINLVPFPKLNFFAPSFGPLTQKGLQSYKCINLLDLLNQTLNPNNLMVTLSSDQSIGKYISSSVFFRGKLPIKEIENHIQNFRNKFSKNYIENLPNAVNLSLCDIPPKGLKISSSYLSNSTGIKEKLNNENFSSMFRRKAFLYVYTMEGSDEMEFTEADSLINDIVSLYQEHEGVTSNSNDSPKKENDKNDKIDEQKND